MGDPFLRPVGKSSAPDRELFVAEVTDLGEWPETLDLSASAFVAFTAVDAHGVPWEALVQLGRKLVQQGCVYLCAWGPDCGRVHDAIDIAAIELSPAVGHVMTTWHDDEPLDDALYFSLFDAWDEEGKASAVIALTAPQWREEIERRLRDSEGLRRELLAAEDR